MDNNSIKDNIRKLRKQRRLTQEEMALQLGISLTAYRDFEKGKTSILHCNLTKIASLLDTPTEEVLLGYKPSQIEGTKLEDVEEEYNGKIAILETRIADLEKLVHSKEETIRNMGEIILMLKQKLGEDK